MDRRNFAKLLAASGLAAYTPLPLIERKLIAQTAGRKKYVLVINLNGGWDHKSLIAVKKDANVSAAASYGLATINGIEYAKRNNAAEQNINTFMTQHGEKIRVVQGVEMGTNAHTIGRRISSAGVGAGSAPTLAALVAATLGGGKALSFLGDLDVDYNRTGGIITKTMVNNPDNVATLLTPNVGSVFSAAQHQNIVVANKTQLENSLGQDNLLPQDMNLLRQFRSARVGQTSDIATFTLPGFDALGNNRDRKKAMLILRAMQHGLTQAGTIDLNGFDTHDDHENRFNRALLPLFPLLHYIMDKAAEYQLLNDLLICVASDFGRDSKANSKYNDRNGTDHWTVGKYMFIGNGIETGLFGASDNRDVALKIGRNGQNDSNGQILTVGEMHHNIHRLFGIEEHPLVKATGISGRALDIF